MKTHSHINIKTCCSLQCAEKIMTDAKIEKFLKDRDAKLVECKRRADLTGFYPNIIISTTQFSSLLNINTIIGLAFQSLGFLGIIYSPGWPQGQQLG